MTDWFKIFSDKDAAIGEVISSSHVGFQVQSYRYEYAYTPEYGSILVTNCDTHLTIGVVVGTKIEPAPGLPSVPVPLKATRSEIRQKYPDLEGRFIDVYDAVTIGYYASGRFYQSRPRRKPLIHDLVYIPGSEFIEEFHFSSGSSMDYLPILVSAVSVDELKVFLEIYLNYLIDKLGEEKRYLLFEAFSSAAAKYFGDNVVDLLLEIGEKVFLGVEQR